MGLFHAWFGRSYDDPLRPANSPDSTGSFTLKSPMVGELVSAQETGDPTFAEEILGPSVAFKLGPDSDCTVYAPCDGVITQMFKTGHAVTISSKEGQVEMLIHVGINTVDLKGKGFTALVSDDQEVKAGEPLIKFDGEFLRSRGYELIVPMAICNASDFADISFIQPEHVTLDTEICSIKAS